MAKLLEHSCKELLLKAGIRVPRGMLVSSPSEAFKASSTLGGSVVLKAQLPITGRLRLNAIRFADTPEEAEREARELLAGEFGGFKVEKVLVEERVRVEREFYLGVIVNYSYKVKGPTLLFSLEGGAGIEEVAERRPEAVVRMDVDYLEGVDYEGLVGLLEERGLDERVARGIVEVFKRLYEGVFVAYDALSAEINPLALTVDGGLVALDCRVTIDDNSLYRHGDLKVEGRRGLSRPPTELEERLWRWEDADPRGTGYFIQLATDTEGGGYIGFHGIGGGGAMLAVDALARAGLKVANYADTSGDPPASKVYRVVKTILSQPGIEGYILMGSVIASQEQWHHAHALVKALREMLRDRPGFPVLILIAGNKEEETHEILRRGLGDLPIRLEIYGRDYVYETEYIAERMKMMVEEYRGERGGG